jgi:hypothetical protein
MAESSPISGSGIAIALGASFMGYPLHAGFMAKLSEHGVRPWHSADAPRGHSSPDCMAQDFPCQPFARPC